METRRIDADRLLERVMRLSHGDLRATWTTAGIVRVIEEETAEKDNTAREIS